MEWIPEADFATSLSVAPQVCVDLVVRHEGGILLVRRTTEPAAGEWFWPGGRVHKGERLAAAVRRVARGELGLSVTIDRQLGAAEHFWETSSVPGVETRHTVPIVYQVRPTGDVTIDLDDHHDDWRLVTEAEPGAHEYVRAYFDRWSLLGEDDH